MKDTEVFMWSARYFWLIFITFEFYVQSLIKAPNIKFRRNPYGGSRTDARGQTYMTKLMIAFRPGRTCLTTRFLGERVVLSYLWWVKMCGKCSVWGRLKLFRISILRVVANSFSVMCFATLGITASHCIDGGVSYGFSRELFMTHSCSLQSTICV
jgi:hypothetical protein